MAARTAFSRGERCGGRGGVLRSPAAALLEAAGSLDLPLRMLVRALVHARWAALCKPTGGIGWSRGDGTTEHTRKPISGLRKLRRARSALGFRPRGSDASVYRSYSPDEGSPEHLQARSLHPHACDFHHKPTA